MTRAEQKATKPAVQQAPPSGGDAMPGFTDAAPAVSGVTLVLAHRERVVGEYCIRDKRDAAETGAGGGVHPGTLFGFAHELALAGVRQHLLVEQAATLIDAKTVLLVPADANRISGEAVPLLAPEGLAVWQTHIHTDDGATVAIIVQTFRTEERAVDAGTTADAGAAGNASADATDTSVPPVARLKRVGTPPGMSDTRVAENRLEAIVRAASEVIARKGFAGATIREIADAAGLHVPTMYQYVSGKHELLERVYSHEMQLMKRDLEQIARGADTATETVTKMTSAALDVADRRRRQIGILNRELKHLRPDARARMIAEYRDLIDRYEVQVAAGVANGEFRKVDPFIVANLVDMASDLWALRQFFFGEYALDAYRDEVIALLMKGLASEDGGDAGEGLDDETG